MDDIVSGTDLVWFGATVVVLIALAVAVVIGQSTR